jgi:hypothetical protein
MILNKLNKREIVKPLKFCYSSKNAIERYLENKFRTNRTTDITIDKVSVKISINQIAFILLMIKNISKSLEEEYSKGVKRNEEIALKRRYTLSSLIKKFVLENEMQDEFMEFPVVDEISKSEENPDFFSNMNWNVPNAKMQEHAIFIDEEEKKIFLNSKVKSLEKLANPNMLNKSNIGEEKKKDVEKENEKIGTDTFTFLFSGLSIYIINYYKDNFIPMLCFDFKDTNFIKDSREEGKCVSQSQLEAQFSYYSINNENWEPFIEGLNITFGYDKQDKKKVVLIKGKESIDLNISPDFVSVINNWMKSWNQTQKQTQDKNIKEEFKDFIKEFNIFEEDKNEPEIDPQSANDTALFSINEDENTIDIATPYKVWNMTGMHIIIQTLFEHSKGIKNIYILDDRQTTKIASKNFDVANNKTTDNVKIMFPVIYLPIESNFFSFKIYRNITKQAGQWDS